MQFGLLSPLLGFVVLVPATIWGATHGYQGGLRNDPIFTTCLWAWLKVSIAVGAVIVCAAALFAITGFATGMNNTLTGTGLILLFGLALAIFYLPLAGISAMIGHLVGMQRRTREHLERIEDVMAATEFQGPVPPGS